MIRGPDGKARCRHGISNPTGDLGVELRPGRYHGRAQQLPASCIVAGAVAQGGVVRSFKFKEVHGASGNARTYVGSVVLADRFSQLKILAKILGAI